MDNWVKNVDISDLWSETFCKYLVCGNGEQTSTGDYGGYLWKVFYLHSK